ncbi:MAG: PAS domain-containing protein [Rhodospirillaceae bacterium]
MSVKTLLKTEESIALLAALADNSFDSVLITDTSKQGKIIYANKAFQKLTGYSAKDVIGKTPRLLQGAATDKAVIARLAKALKTGGKFEGKAINYKKDKTPFIMHWRVVPVKAKGKIVAWAAIQRSGSAL